ncbi:MAG: hypothetical protein AAF799_07995 [Myxococcota bacterium]
MNSITPGRDPVSEPIAALLDVYGQHAKALCFPDIDHSTLDANAKSLREAAAEVERCELALATARRALDEHRQGLEARATRALAYARIYAQDDPELQQSLGTIELSPRRPTARRTNKKNGSKAPRARRSKAAKAGDSVTELPFAADEAGEVPQADVA